MNYSLLASPFVIPFIVMAFLSAVMAFKTWWDKNTKLWEWITLLLGASFIWSSAQAFEYISTTLAAKVFWDDLQWFGIAIIPPAFLLLALDFVGLRRRNTLFALLLLGIIPAVILALVFTNYRHHFFVTEYNLVQIGAFLGMSKQYQFGFWAFMIYSYILFCSALFHLIWMHLRSPNFYANQIRWIAVAASITVVISALDTLNISPYPYFQPTVLAMSGFTLVVAGNLQKLRSMDVKRASRGQLLETISDPLILFDDGTTLIDLNVPAQNLLHVTRTDALGKVFEEVAPEVFERVSHLFQHFRGEESATLELPGHPIPYFARMIHIRDDTGRLHSRALAFSTVFDHNQIAAELQRSNSFIKALGQVAAHVASASSPNEVMKTMGEELSELGVRCAYVTFDHPEGSSSLEYLSVDIKIIKPIEKMFGQRLIGLKQEHTLWPSHSKQALREYYPVYVTDFLGAVTEVFSNFRRPLVVKALQLGGITSNTRGIYIPLRFSNDTGGIITVWGETLSEKDLAAFSIFGKQIESSFEQARILESEMLHSQELRNSNALIQALSEVALQAASTFDPQEVLITLGNALNNLGMRYSIFKVERDLASAFVEYVSPDLEILQKLEKISGISPLGYRIERGEWSPVAVTALESRKPAYIPNFLETAVWPFRKFGNHVTERGARLIGADENTNGYFFPLFFNDGEIRMLMIWGQGLQEKDLPVFSVFANQVSSAFESARLYSAERGQAKAYKRSQDLIESLSGVAARISSTSDPEQTMATLGMELKKFGVDCLVALLDFDTREAYIRFHSMDLKMMKAAEKITGQVFTDQRLPLNQWPDSIVSVFENGQPVYLDKFLEHSMTFMPKIARPVARKAFGLVGVNAGTTGYFLPLEVQGSIFGCLAIWGQGLQKSDLPAYSVFASQVAGALENARLYDVEHEQAILLERSNALLSALSRIAMELTLSNALSDVWEVMQAEFEKLGLDFTFTTLNADRQEAVIEFISLNLDVQNQIKKISGISLTGRKLPKALWPKEDLELYDGFRPQYHPSFSEAMYPLFRKAGKRLYREGLKFAGILECTPGIILPLSLSNGRLGFLAIWGDSLREKDMAAFSVFTRQVESTLESWRLIEQAEQEIAERRAAQDALFESREEFRGLFENAHDAILIFDPVTLQVLNVNERACEVYGFNRQEFMSIKLDAISQNVDLIIRHIEHNIESNKHFNFETVQTRKDGTPMDLEIHASIVYFHGKKAVQCINRDVTSRKRYEEKLSHDAFHDGLTDLPNRALFLDRLTHAIARRQRNSEASFAVLFLDLDRFKDVNDSLGHLMGDQLLIEIAQRLKGCVRKVDTVARLGGDEFAILLEETKSIHEVTDSCLRIMDHIYQPIELADNEILVSGSVGVVISSEEYMKPEEYMRDADIAMYRAKESGKSRFEIFDASMRTVVLERLQLEANLRKAIPNQELMVLYQPIFDLATAQIAGVEALIRWRTHDGRIVSPADFIPVAEESGLIHQIGEWVLQESCTQLKGWYSSSESFDRLTMSVNVSGIQLMKSEFPADVEKVIRETGIDPGKLILEITESVLIRDQKIASERIHALKALGVKIHLDDFGTGYSSLSFLSQFPIDALKIDRQFVVNYDRGNQADLVGVIATLGNRLKLKVIAEGIETGEQLAFLREVGCKFGQGYYFSKPVEALAIKKLLGARPTPATFDQKFATANQ